MTKKLLFIVCLVFLTAFSSFAQNPKRDGLKATEGFIYHGYCDYHEPDWSKGIGYEEDPQTHRFYQIQVAASSFFPQLLMRPYINSTIVGVRIAVADRVKNAKVFIKRWYTDKENLVEKTITLEKGWNEVMFDKGVVIEKRQPYTIGYEYDNPSQEKHYLMLADGNTKGPGVASFVANNGKEPMAVTDWLGCFYQQMIIKGDLPEMQNKVGMDNLRIGLVAIDKKIIPFQFTLRNIGSNNVKSYSASIFLNNEKVKEISGNLSLNPLDSVNIVENKLEASNGDSLKIVLNTVNGKSAADTLKTKIEGVLPYAYPRMVLMEEFSTEKCASCPQGITALNKVLSDKKYGDNIISITHHVGYEEDTYTLPESRNLLGLYGGDGTFAPAFSLDRIPSMYSEGNPYPIHTVGTTEKIAGYFEEAMARPSLASIKIETTTDVKANKVNFSVSGEAIMGHIDPDNCYLNIYVVEDKIISTKQNGTKNKPFELNGVIRKFVTPAEGMKQAITKEGTYTYSGSFDLADDWRKDRLRVVAFLSKKLLPKIEEHSSMCAVYNSAQAVVKGFESVEQVDFDSSYSLYVENGTLYVSGNAVIMNIYAMNGEQVANGMLNAGVYFAKIQTAEGIANIKFIVK